MMKIPFLKTGCAVATLILCTAFPGKSQVIGTVPSPYESIEQNSVSNIAAFGDTLWIGPGMNRNIGNEPNWYLPQGADSVTAGRGRVFSLALAPDTVLTGLGYTANTPGGNVQTGLGYYRSIDGGDTWSFLELPLDTETDTTLLYGGEIYKMLPITVRQQSAPFKVDFRSRTIFSANWASGIMRSTDFGHSWHRLMLPPLSADSLVPEKTYAFSSQNGNVYDPRGDQNLLGFSVFIDSNGTVWAGTAGGINISPDALTAPQDSVRWYHLQAGDSGLLGNWIVSISQQPSTGDIWLTNWLSGISENEQNGIVRTSDDGESFDQYLEGKRINDIGFVGNHVFAAGDDGLYHSPNNGQTWEQIKQIRGENNIIKSTARYFTVAATTNRIWVGTSDGLASTVDLGDTWQITRVNFPLTGGNQYQNDAPAVETYAYPNPFSPSRQDIVRIKFEVQRQGNVKIRLFDFGMNLIRELENESYTPGTYEAVWNGRDHDGNIVANGPVFYQVETPGNIARGKILVLD